MSEGLVQMYHTSEMPQLTKAEAFANLQVYDTALPQDWLDDFVAKSGLDYHFVLATTVWCYDRTFMGGPVTYSIEVYEKLKQFNEVV